jgi:hypothetical protein
MSGQANTPDTGFLHQFNHLHSLVNLRSVQTTARIRTYSPRRPILACGLRLAVPADFISMPSARNYTARISVRPIGRFPDHTV